MLHHRLAGAEGAGDGGGAPLGHGEEGVHDPLSGLEGHHRGILVLIGAAHTDRPFLHHGQLHPGAVLLFQHGHRLGDGKGAALDGHDGPLHSGGQHDLVEDGLGLLDRAQHIATHHPGPGLDGRGERPLLLPVQGGHLHAPGESVASADLPDDLQRALDPVVNILDQAGAQLHGQGRAGGDHLSAGPQSGGLLIDLDGGGVPSHIQDLADQALLAHTDHVGHVGLLHPCGHHQRAGDLDDLSHRLITFFRVNFYKISAPTARSTALVTLAMPMPSEPSLPGMRMMAGVRAS